MSRATRTVFLDIDGVVAPSCRRNPSVLDAECIERVRRLHRHAKIVLSSSWPSAEARAVLPIDDELDEHARCSTSVARLRGIVEYLRRHPRIRQWVSIDDDLLAAALARTTARGESLPLDPERLLRTDWHVGLDGSWDGKGLTEETTAAVIALLRPELVVEIRRHVAAMERHEERLQSYRKRTRSDECCPSCKFGHEYTLVSDAAEACGSNLRRLLAMRGTGDDLYLAESIRLGTWP